jgi:hypothetical protein
MRREWVLGLAVLALGVAGLLVWAWIDAGVEPVRALTAPAMVPGVPQ